ncbi:MAG: hypothetical protein ACOYWZ_09520 [Bacillota bacterium]
MNKERCLPCEISVAGGMLIKDHCKKDDCKEIAEKFSKGEMSLRDLAKELNVPNEELSLFSKQGIDLDMTLKKAVDIENKV